MMSQHYTKSTIQAEHYCKKCERITPHRVYDGRIQHCLKCAEDAEAKPRPAITAGPVQGRLF